MGDRPFGLGVASGDPLPGAVVLWTRVTPAGPLDHDVVLAWDVARDQGFAELVASGTVAARAAEAHSVHLDVTGLVPATQYWYRFRTPDAMTGPARTVTAPAAGAAVEHLRVAAVSCQDFQAGYYRAYDDLAEQAPDVVLFLGDYIYEGGPSDRAVRPNNGPSPTDLDGYRRRYAQYKADPSLQAAHAAAPWIVTWDDHEVQNNYAGLVPANAEDAEAFPARRAAAYRAWWEHQPVRLPPPDGPDLQVYRSFGWGKLASFVVLDGRQYRSDQPCGDGVGAPCAERVAEGATMLGPAQEAWVADQFAAAGGAGVTWTMLANQTVLTDMVVRLGTSSFVLFDQWDGYPAARRRLLSAARQGGVANLVALTGDIHASIVGTVDLDGTPVGTELVATSVSSTFASQAAGTFALGMALVPNVKLAETAHRGYVLCDIGPQQLVATYRWVDDATKPTSTVQAASSWLVRAGTPGAVRQ